MSIRKRREGFKKGKSRSSKSQNKQIRRMTDPKQTELQTILTKLTDDDIPHAEMWDMYERLLEIGRPEHILNIAVQGSHKDMRRKAIQELEEYQDLLLHAGKEIEDPSLRAEVVKNMMDQDMIFILAIREKEQEVVDEILIRLQDDEIIADLVDSQPPLLSSPHNQNMLLSSIDDTTVLIDAMDNADLDRSIVAKHMKRIKDDGDLLYLIENSKDEDIIREGIQSVHSDDLLLSIALTSDEMRAFESMKHITDEEKMGTIAKNSENEFVQKEAIRHINDPDILTEIAIENADEASGRAVDKLKKMNQIDHLGKIANMADDDENRKSAGKYVQEHEMYEMPEQQSSEDTEGRVGSSQE